MKKLFFGALFISLLFLSNNLIASEDIKTSKVMNLLITYDFKFDLPSKIMGSYPLLFINPATKELFSIIQMTLINDPRFNLIAREHLNQILEELNLAATGLVDRKYATKIGKLAGADAILYLDINYGYYSRTESKKEKRSWPKKDVYIKQYNYFYKGRIEFKLLDTKLGVWKQMKIFESSSSRPIGYEDYWDNSLFSTDWMDRDKIINMIKPEVRNFLMQFMDVCYQN